MVGESAATNRRWRRAQRRAARPARPTPPPAFKGVPRWRRRMEPACTHCPPKRLPPSRCPALSRPLLLLPWPFLCALANPYRALISVTLTAGKGRRCPRRILYWLFFLNLKTRTLSALACSTMVPATLALASVGLPSFISPSPPRASTSLKVTLPPPLPGRISTRTTSPSAPRYCFPPLRITAYTGFRSPSAKNHYSGGRRRLSIAPGGG